MTCNHTIYDQETAVTADGLCPLCLAVEVAQLREKIKRLEESNHNLRNWARELSQKK